VVAVGLLHQTEKLKPVLVSYHLLICVPKVTEFLTIHRIVPLYLTHRV